MVTLQELHGFIRSLNKAEKRFFKLLTATENSDIEKALNLFDYLDKIRNSDDLELRLKKGSRSILGQDNVNKLYQLILSSQRNFYADNIPGFGLIDEVNNLKILFEKAQYRQCRKMLKSTKDCALSLEKFGTLLQLVEIEKHLLAQEILDDSFGKLYETLDEEYKQYGELEKNIAKFFTIYAQIHNKVKNGVVGNESYFSDALVMEQLNNPQSAACKKSLFLLYKCRAIAQMALHNAGEAATELSNAKELMQSNALIFHEMPRHYIDVLFHSARVELILKGQALVPSLTELENILESGKMPAIDLNLKLRSYIFLIRLQMCFNGRSISETEMIADEILNFIKINQRVINREDAGQLLFALTNYYLYTLSFSKARDTHAMLRVYTDRNNQTDLRNYSVLQEYIISFETANSAQIKLIKPSLQKIITEGFFKKDETNVIRLLLDLPDNLNAEAEISEIIKDHHKQMTPDTFRDSLDLSYLNCINYLISKAGKDFPVQTIFKTNTTLSETNS